MDDIKAIMVRDFQLEPHELPGEDQDTLSWLSDYVAYLMEYRLEYLLSWLYRMDIAEKAVQEALSPYHPLPANQAIAQLILDRQEERTRTKKAYPQPELTAIEEELRW
ncbi:MAG: hypothetical protein AAGI23_04585 [Bacteroidota bacterium]